MFTGCNNTKRLCGGGKQVFIIICSSCRNHWWHSARLLTLSLLQVLSRKVTTWVSINKYAVLYLSFNAFITSLGGCVMSLFNPNQKFAY